MKKTSETIVFFGSGPVAAKSLELLSKNFTIEAVVTKPRPPHHKGAVPVLELAEHLGMPVLTAADKQSLDELFASRPVRSRAAVLIDFGIIVSQAVIDYFELGIINSHFSLLPEWRGADPITFSVLSGQKLTGISLMVLTAGMDKGPLLAQADYAISSGTTTPQLTEDLIELSDRTLTAILPLYLEGAAQAAPQETISIASSKVPTYSRKLTKADALLDFTKPAAQLEREVRAFAEWPRSRTKLNDIDVIVTAAHVERGSGQPGTLYYQGQKLGIHTSDGILIIDSLKPSGKNEMSAAEFIRGYRGRLSVEG